jgi:hypothetical protein
MRDERPAEDRMTSAEEIAEGRMPRPRREAVEAASMARDGKKSESATASQSASISGRDSHESNIGRGRAEIGSDARTNNWRREGIVDQE